MSLLSSFSLMLIYITMQRLVTNPVVLLLGFSAFNNDHLATMF